MKGRLTLEYTRNWILLSLPSFFILFLWRNKEGKQTHTHTHTHTHTSWVYSQRTFTLLTLLSLLFVLLFLYIVTYEGTDFLLSHTPFSTFLYSQLARLSTYFAHVALNSLHPHLTQSTSSLSIYSALNILCSCGSQLTLLMWLSTHFTYCLSGPVIKAASVEQALKLFTSAEVCVFVTKAHVCGCLCVCICVYM